MAEPLKYIYNTAFLDDLSSILASILPNFDADKFKTEITKGDWEKRELKQRMRRITETLHKVLPSSYPQAVEKMMAISSILQKRTTAASWGYMFLPEYFELYGIEHLDISLDAMEKVTQFTSCEFAIRPFIIRYPEKVMQRMLAWSKHSHHHVRRFSSEGCRPRLPWAMAIPNFKKDPSPILPILQNLKDDESEFVRKSVANNLNDISKDHPELLISIVKKWKGHASKTDWILKHASRTLLKAGNQEVMQIFGYGNPALIDIKSLMVDKPIISIGGNLQFSFDLINRSEESQLTRIEYGIYYLRGNGSHSKKVFKISEKPISGSKRLKIERKQSFKLITTRRYYPGPHKVSIIINGLEKVVKDFILAPKT